MWYVLIYAEGDVSLTGPFSDKDAAKAWGSAWDTKYCDPRWNVIHLSDDFVSKPLRVISPEQF